MVIYDDTINFSIWNELCHTVFMTHCNSFIVFPFQTIFFIDKYKSNLKIKVGIRNFIIVEKITIVIPN